MGLFLGAVVAILLMADCAMAHTLSLTAPSLANVRGRVTARFTVAVEELPVLKGELMDGEVLMLKCRVQLSESNDYWLDDEVTSALFWSTLKYDSLTRQFVMKSSDRADELRGADIGSLLQEGWTGIEVVLGSWALLDRGEKYSLVVETILNEYGAHEGVMKYILFWDWDSASTNSFQLDFTH